MRYTLPNGKTINIDEAEIQHHMKVLSITKDEAIQLYLEDNDLLENEELEELDKKAKQNKIKHEATAKDTPRKKSDKPRTVKISDEKQELFKNIYENLKENYENVKIEKENKLILLEINGKKFKIDLIQQREPKNK